MNRSKLSDLPTSVEERSLAVRDADSNSIELEEDTPAVRQSLFLAWSSARRSSVGQQCLVTIPDALGDQWDWGDWLLSQPSIGSTSRAQPNDTGAETLYFHDSARPCYAAIKRTTDVILSLFLLILLLPFSALLALAIRLDSAGPAIFRQRRIGKDGRSFMLWKFRSMCMDAPSYAVSPKSDDDPRLTRIGRLIRRVSIDELPQLINVFRGEMSLVGPRPEMPFIVDGYTEFERQRLLVKPGITGLWQVSPARAFPINENLQYDLYYILHQNPLLDGAILVRTITAVIRGVGAI